MKFYLITVYSMPAVQSRVVIAPNAVEAVRHIARNLSVGDNTELKVERYLIEDTGTEPRIERNKNMLKGKYNELIHKVNVLDE
ncbi:MAG: hypothetical protein WCI57_00885 [Candidatus Berkelbacteria bacterium]